MLYTHTVEYVEWLVVGVADAPFFEQDREPVYSWGGKTRNMTCVVRAEPDPAIKWYRFDREIQDNETFRVYHMYKSSNLQVSQALLCL